MPERVNWPPGPRRLVTVMFVVAYLMFALAGLDSLREQSVRFQEDLRWSHTITTISLVVVAAGVVAAVEVARRRWKSELRAIAGMGGALAVYNIFDWWSLLFMYPDMPVRGAAVVTGAWCLLVIRGAYLYVFSLTATETKRLRRSRGRST